MVSGMWGEILVRHKYSKGSAYDLNLSSSLDRQKVHSKLCCGYYFESLLRASEIKVFWSKHVASTLCSIRVDNPRAVEGQTTL